MKIHPYAHFFNFFQKIGLQRQNLDLLLNLLDENSNLALLDMAI